MPGDIENGKLLDLVQIYQASLAPESHAFEPLLNFFRHLILASEQATKTIFQAGIMELLLHIHHYSFLDPFATTGTLMFNKSSTLRASCDSLLETCSKNKKRSKYLANDRLYVLWSPQLKSPLSPYIPNRSARRAEIWRSMEPESITLRIRSISNMMLLEEYRGLLEQDWLDDIASDILEFSK